MGKGMPWFCKTQQVEDWQTARQEPCNIHSLWPTNFTQEFNLRKYLERQTMIGMQGYCYKHRFWNLSRVTTHHTHLCGNSPSPVVEMLSSYPSQLPSHHWWLEKAELGTRPKLGQWEFPSPWPTVMYTSREGQLLFKLGFTCTWSSADIYCSIRFNRKSLKHKMCSDAGLVKETMVQL